MPAGLAHLYVFCKGGDDEGGHSFSAGAVAVEQLSELCFRGGGRGANQSVGGGQDENPDASSMSPHLYKERKGGPAPYDFVLDGSNPLDEYQGSVWPTVWSRTNGGIFTYANGTTYFNRTDNLGTPRVSTDYTGAVKRTETMGPFGDGFTESYAGLDFTGFAGGVWDQENNGDHFGAREYAKTQGRWLTPDPAGLAAVDPSNPQTWNRYAYVRNNPVSGVDPTGLNDMNFWDSPAWLQTGVNTDPSFGPPDPFGAAPSLLNGELRGAEAEAEAAYSPFVLQFGGSLYGKLYQGIFPSWDDYADWRTGIAALPESQVYAAFSVICQNQGCDPNELVPVTYQHGNMVYSVQMDCAVNQGCTVATDNLDGFWSDPVTFLHQGNPSWYSGYFLDTPHLIGSDPLGAHIDPFGPLNPLHYLIQMPSMLFPSSGWQGASCALNGGCSFQ